MTAADREQALIAVVDTYRARECERLKEDAVAEATRLLHEARQEARRRVHRAAVRERDQATVRIRAAQAELDTRRREHEQRLGWALLQAARGSLEDALRQYWLNEDTRRQWIEAAVERAFTSLPPGHWRLRHPSDWSDVERSVIDSALASRGVEQPVDFQEDATLRAGLVISSGGTLLDSSLAGLLADKVAIEARFLALMSGEQAP